MSGKGDGTVETRDTAKGREAGTGAGAAQPGAVLLLSGGRPTCIAVRLADGARVAFGRGSFGGAMEDSRVSLEHVFVTRTGAEVIVEDNASRNGTFVDGLRREGAGAAKFGALVRVGHSLFLLCDDVRRFEAPSAFEKDGDVIVGPTLGRAHALIERAAAAGEAVLFCGETGSGKELAARVFHRAAGRTGPLVAVNCAAIPTGVAERLLFGAKRGAYSGADADAEGYLQAADRGTLFLDEVAELDLLVQAKLLRAIEAQEVLPVGAARPRKVDVRVCSATHKDLRAEIGAGRFRQDLYFRIGRPEVVIPPLRARPEELAFLIHRALAAEGGPPAHASFVEACLLLPWPGNVRELLVEVRRAAHEARARGADAVAASDLHEGAGRALAPLAASPSVASSTAAMDGDVVARRRAPPADDERIRRALREHDGNVTAAARALGIHRNQLRRWVERQRDRG